MAPSQRLKALIPISPFNKTVPSVTDQCQISSSSIGKRLNFEWHFYGLKVNVEGAAVAKVATQLKQKQECVWI